MSDQEYFIEKETPSESPNWIRTSFTFDFNIDKNFSLIVDWIHTNNYIKNNNIVTVWFAPISEIYLYYYKIE